MRTLAEREAEREADERPAGALVWWRLRGARADVDQADEWTRHEIPEHVLAEQRANEERELRRLRGDQSYPSLHLGKGTKWIKPRSTK